MSEPSEEARWARLSARPLPQWFDEARLGIFVHWGVYSVAGWAEPTAELGTVADDREWFTHNPYAEWYANTIRIADSPAALHHQQTYDGAPYDDLLDRWHRPTVDHAELLATFAQAGASYVVLTTKHHDGLTLWDAPGTGLRNTVRQGPRLDLVRVYADAARSVGLRFGAYYSGGLDWHVRPSPPHLSAASVEDVDRPKDLAYAAYAASHVRDLIERYRPDVLWDDIDWPDAGKDFGPHGIGRVFEDYYAQVPDGVVNDRWRVPHSDYLTSEYQMDLAKEGERPWENCRGIGLSFGYNANEEGVSLDSPGVLRHVLDAACRGGRVLLGVGPMADGTLPACQSVVLAQMARWMSVVGDVLPGLSPDGGAPEVGAGTFVRRGRNAGGRYLVVDSVEGDGPVDLPAPGGHLLTPDWARLQERDGGLRVLLDPARPGPAVLRAP